MKSERSPKWIRRQNLTYKNCIATQIRRSTGKQDYESEHVHRDDINHINTELRKPQARQYYTAPPTLILVKEIFHLSCNAMVC